MNFVGCTNLPRINILQLFLIQGNISKVLYDFLVPNTKKLLLDKHTKNMNAKMDFLLLKFKHKNLLSRHF